MATIVIYNGITNLYDFQLKYIYHNIVNLTSPTIIFNHLSLRMDINYTLL